MKLIDLIKKSKTVTCQSVSACMTKISVKKSKNGPLTEVSFLTQEINPTDVMNQTDKIGIVFWIPRDEFEKVTS